MLVMLCYLTGFSQILKKEETSQLKFRHIGPVGNRISCAIGLPNNDLVYFGGAATGGLWKTVDGGLNWKPVFDDKNVASVSALAAANSDANIMFAGGRDTICPKTDAGEPSNGRLPVIIT